MSTNIKRIGHTKENEWSKKDIAYLTKHYPTGSLIEVTKQLNRSYTAIRGKADKLNLKRANRYWSNEDEQWLLDNWQVMTAVEIGEELGKTRWAVINKHRELTGKRRLKVKS